MKAIVAELADLLRGVADGTPPPTDSELTVVQPPDERSVGVLAFPGQHIIVADVSVEWVQSWLAGDDLSEPFSPQFLGLLSAVTGRATGNIDTVLVARAHGRRRGLELAEITDSDHPRVARAKLHRAEVRAWACPGGLLVIGRGVAGRWEAAVEVDAAVRGFGLGRGLFGAALGLLPEGESVWAQVAPGNAASLRALLAAGYRPVGGEVLFEPRAELVDGEPVEWFGSYLPVDDWQEDEEFQEPESAQPESAQPELADLELAEPEPARPEPAQPELPEPARPEPARPERARSEPARRAPVWAEVATHAAAERPEPTAANPELPSAANPAHANPAHAKPEPPEPAEPEPAEPKPAPAQSAAEFARAEPEPPAAGSPDPEPSAAGPVPGAEPVQAEDAPFEPVYVRLPPIDPPVRAPRPVGGDKRPIETQASAAELAAAEADAEAELDADEDTELAERDEP